MTSGCGVGAWDAAGRTRTGTDDGGGLLPRGKEGGALKVEGEGEGEDGGDDGEHAVEVGRALKRTQEAWRGVESRPMRGVDGRVVGGWVDASGARRWTCGRAPPLWEHDCGSMTMEAWAETRAAIALREHRVASHVRVVCACRRRAVHLHGATACACGVGF
jgi:hypothetical protein